MSENKFNEMVPAEFNHEMFGVIRVLKGNDGEIWFVALDVCKALGLTDARKSVGLLDEDERNTVPVTDSLGREQHTFIINESGLYSLVLRSRKPEAKKFKKWVTSEVLPSIRKHGAYINKNVASPEFLREMADIIEQKNLEIAEKNKQLAEAKPKVICTDNLTSEMQRFKPTVLAGMLKVSYTTFRAVAMAEGLLVKKDCGGVWDFEMRYVPTSNAYRASLVVDREGARTGVDYDFTPAGAKFMIQALCKRGYMVPEVI